MQKQAFIVTGTTKGIGNAVTKLLLLKGHDVYGIARSKNPFEENNNYIHNQFSIDDIKGMDRVFDDVEKKISQYNYVCLFNNAAVVEPLKSIENITDEEIEEHIKINLSSPTIICAHFIRKFKGYRLRKRIVNMTSGSAKLPMHDMALYSSTKAAISMLTECLGKEQDLSDDKFEINSINPGMVETSMVKHSRNKDENIFRAAKLFKVALEKGKVQDVDCVSEKILSILNGNYPNGVTINAQEI